MTRRPAHMCRDEHAEILHSDGEHERCPLCRALDYLSAIEDMTAGEITARFGGHSSKTEDEVGQKSAVYHLLVVPRNIARKALAELRVTVGEHATQEDK